MSSLTTVGVYQVDARVITDITATAATIPLSDCVNHDQWVVVFTDSLGETLVCDISRSLISVPSIDWSSSLGDFINTVYASDKAVYQALTTTFPVIDPQTKRFTNRVDVFDPVKTTGIHITYGRIEVPGNTGAKFRGVSKDLIFVLDPLVITSNPNNWIVFVNGVAHKTVVATADGVTTVWVIDGFENVKQSRSLELCVLDTTLVGGHTLVPITDSMVVANDDTIHQSFHLTTSGLTLGSKTTLLCVDGYLHCLDDTYRTVTDDRIQINTHRMQLIPQFIQNPNQRFYTDIFGVKNRVNPLTGQNVTLDLSTTPDANDTYLDCFTNAKSIDPSTLSTPAFVRSRFTSNHSFLIVINNPTLYTAQWAPITYGDAGNLFEVFSASTPRGFAQYGYGKIVPFVITSSEMRRHTFYITQLDTSSDEYLDVLNPDLIASRKAAILNPGEPRRFTITELYSGALSS